MSFRKIKFYVFLFFVVFTAFATENNAVINYSELDSLFQENHPDAFEYARKLIEAAKHQGDNDLLFETHRLISFYVETRLEKLDHLMTALEIAEMLEDDFRAGQILIDLAETSRSGQNYSNALEYINRAERLFSSIGHKHGLAHALNRRAAINFEIGPRDSERLNLVLIDARHSLTISEELGIDRISFNNLNIIGAAQTSLGKPDAARVNLERALEIIDTNNWQVVKPNILNNLASVYKELGDWDRAIEIAEESLELAREQEIVPYILGAREALYHANKYKGDFESALYNLELLTALSIEQYFSERDELIHDLHVRYETRQKAQAIEVEKMRRRLERVTLLSLFVTMFFITALTVLFVLRQKNKTIKEYNSIIESQLYDIQQLYKEKDKYLYRFNLVASSFDMGIWERNIKTGHIYWDSRMYNVFDIHHPPYPKPEDVIDLYIDRKDMLIIEKMFENAILDKGLIHHVFNIRTEKARIKWLELHAVVIFDDMNKPETVTGAIRDISRLKIMEFEALAIQDQIHDEQKLESLNVMAGGIAHDFNNLLTVIIGNLEMAQNCIPDKSNGSILVSKAISAVDRAEEIIQKMLDFSGSARSLPGMMDISEILEEDRSKLEAYVPESISITWNLARNLPLVRIDRVQFHQVVVNILKNSIEAIYPRSGVVTIETGVKEHISGNSSGQLYHVKPNTRQVVFLTIIDNGCGMDESVMKKMFDPFYTTKMVGRGLGLASVSGIVRGHEGAILVNSEPGTGTAISVLFPVIE